MSDEATTNNSSERLHEMVEAAQYAAAAGLIADANATDVADVLQDFEAQDVASVLLLIDPDRAADILEALPDDLAGAALEQMHPQDAARVITKVVSDEEADILQEVSEPLVERIIEHLDTDQAEMARELLAYDEDTAGGLMQKEFLSVPSGLAAADVVRRLRALGEEGEFYPHSYIYAVNDYGKLDGILSLRALLFTSANTTISSLLNREPVTVSPETPAEEVAKVFRRSHLLSIPVVDATGKMVGIVTQEDAMRYTMEESEEEFLRFSGIAGGEEVRDMPLRERAMKRLLWLVIKMVLNIIPASVVAHYTKTPAFTILAPILPVISDMSGSGGSQSIAVSIRELSLGRIKPSDAGWVFAKEIGVGLINGLILGFLLCAGAWLLTANKTLALVVGLAMLSSTLVAVAVGGLMPIVLRKLRMDPAVASSPILTMVTDTTGFYFVLALSAIVYKA